MSMQGNPHYGRARNIPEGIELWDAPDVPAIMAEAVSEATLALAFEQRLANLIAYRALQGEAIKDGWPMSEAIAEQIAKADARIIEGLNLIGSNGADQ